MYLATQSRLNLNRKTHIGLGSDWSKKQGMWKLHGPYFIRSPRSKNREWWTEGKRHVAARFMDRLKGSSFSFTAVYFFGGRKVAINLQKRWQPRMILEWLGDGQADVNWWRVMAVDGRSRVAGNAREEMTDRSEDGQIFSKLLRVWQWTLSGK